VIGGNVSFYNESGGSDIDPTPVLGVLALVEAVTSAARLACRTGDTLVLVDRVQRAPPPSPWRNALGTERAATAPEHPLCRLQRPRRDGPSCRLVARTSRRRPVERYAGAPVTTCPRRLAVRWPRDGVQWIAARWTSGQPELFTEFRPAS